jgi:Uma2 family endonuclease
MKDMASVRTSAQVRPATGPAWDIARLFPDQGDLSESDYLTLTKHTRVLAEFSDGFIEVLPMPTTAHQRIVRYLISLLIAFAADGRGEVLFAPLRVRLRPGKFREPDVVFMLAAHFDRIKNEYWDGADLVMEVVSEDDPDRDVIEKRREYAEAGIPEYWIVDPRHRSITVLKLEGQQYVVHGEFDPGSRATSALLERFEADVNAVFAAAEARR